MSTRFTIKHDPDADPNQPGFHLFSDGNGTHIEQSGKQVPVVWLELENVEFEVVSQGKTVTVAIPKEWAVKLGLLEADNE